LKIGDDKIIKCLILVTIWNTRWTPPPNSV